IILVWMMTLVLALIPSIYAESNHGTIQVLVYENEEAPIVTTEFSDELGSLLSITSSDLVGITESEFGAFIFDNQMFTTPTKEFVADYMDSNGYLLDIRYDEELYLEFAGVEPTKPGLDFVEFIEITENNQIKVFEATYAVSNPNVTIKIEDIEYIFSYNELITVTTDLADFTHWEDELGQIVSFEQTFKMTALEDMELTPKTDGNITPHLYLRDVTGIRENAESFLARLTLPSGYELIEWGFLGSNTAEDGQHLPKIGDAQVTKMTLSKIHSVSKEFLLSLSSDFAYIRAYMVVKNGESLETIYSDVRNKIEVVFTFDMKWDGMANNDMNGVYVVGTFNNWNTNFKMENNGSIYNINIDFIFIGTQYYAGYKFRHITPVEWNDPEWYGGTWSSPEELWD